MSKQTTGATRRKPGRTQRLGALKTGPREVTPPPFAQPGEESYREYYTRLAKKRHPNVIPENDVHLFILARDLPDKTPEARIKRLAKRYMRPGVTLQQARQKVVDATTKLMNQRATVYGVKPEPGEEDVHYSPIPDSHLDIRIWGKGLSHTHKYCLDFVDRTTREPVNSPADFELWAVPQLNAWWLPSSTGKCWSAENAFGIASDKIGPGREKFCVWEGSSYRLVRKGHKDVFFTVPVRPKPQPAPYWLQDAQIIAFTPENTQPPSLLPSHSP